MPTGAWRGRPALLTLDSPDDVSVYGGPLVSMSRSFARAIAAAGLATGLVLVPGSAGADEPSDVPAESVEGAVDDLGGSDSEAAAETSEPTPFEVPPQLREAFEQFAEQAGISQECVDEVTAALEQIGRGLTTPPAPPEQVIADLQAALDGLPDGPTPEDFAELQEQLEAILDPQNNDVAEGLHRLGEALQSEECRPATPISSTPPASSSSRPPAAAAYTTPTHTPPAAAPAPKPAAYPGYAPTGAESDADAMVPLAAGGTLLLIGAGGAVWARRRWRAARDAG
jgi:hypothetical protein